MVDPISATLATTPQRVAAVTRPAPAPVAAPVADAEAPPPQVAALARSVAATPPVDKERVAQIKAAVANGTFPILPATIADSLMALRYEWMHDDKA